MGLDNGLIFKVKCPSLNFERKYEVCYFRKYWGLRDEILEIFNTEDEQYLYSVSEEDLYAIDGLFEHYCFIDNVRDADLSTIWSNIEELYHMRNQIVHIRFALEFCNEKISLDEFIEALRIWEDDWDRKKNDPIDLILYKWFEMNDSPPEDLEWSFEFYDSY